MSARRHFEVVVPGEPRGAGRPRFGKGRDGTPRAYTAKADREYAGLIATAWRMAGQPYIASGAWTCELTAYMERPRDHYRADGTLSPRGNCSEHPARKPDADNILKVIDALVAVEQLVGQEQVRVAAHLLGLRQHPVAGAGLHERGLPGHGVASRAGGRASPA